MRIGHVILTYKYPAFKELHLAVAAKWLPDMPRLFREDENPWRGQKAILIGWAEACKWGMENGLDWVVVNARRWIPLWNWTESIHDSRYPTLGHPLEKEAGAGLEVIRNEFVALKPVVWMATGAARYLRDRGESGSPGITNAMQDCWEACNIAIGRPPLRHGTRPYEVWDAINGERHRPPKNPTLWHYYSRPEDYERVAHELGLTHLKASDFEVRRTT